MSPPLTPSELAAIAEREATMRRRVYPGWVAKGRMTQAAADREIAGMEQIAREYREKAAADPAGDGRLV